MHAFKMSLNNSSKPFLEPLDSEVMTRTPWSCCPSVNKTADAAMCVKGFFKRTRSLNQRRKQPNRKAKAAAAKKMRHLMRDPSPFPAGAAVLQPVPCKIPCRVQPYRRAKAVAIKKMKPKRWFCMQEVAEDNITDRLAPHEALHLLRGAKLVGSGAFGKVFKVKYKEKAAAFKVGRMQYMEEQFKAEAMILKELNGAGGAPKLLAISSKPSGIVMEFCSGVTFLKILRSPDISRYNKLKVLPVAAEMLHEIHLKGIIHNDVKEDNIMVKLRGEGQTPTVRFVDFGISCKMALCSSNWHSPANDVRQFGNMIHSMHTSFRIDLPEAFVRVGEAARGAKRRVNLPEMISDLKWALFNLKR
ncbi:uncharacterized protein [Macrobrachium rosenbergii]|uniref:uncharacterized protein n=1 Tax=Macrobrachium rosenbergii TaxID=79674 RepID=UPI0034D7771C